jgi:hypothetical protein
MRFYVRLEVEVKTGIKILLSYPHCNQTYSPFPSVEDRPGSYPLRRAAHPEPKYKSNSFTRFGLIHFNSARGIR